MIVRQENDNARIGLGSWKLWRISALLLVIHIAINMQAAHAQDPQFSQFYATPIVSNPAFAGSAFRPRAFAQYRTQWPGTGQPLITYVAAGDAYIRKLSGGLGVILQNDRASGGVVNAFSMSGIYAYHAQLTRKWSANFGGQVGFTSRTVGFNRLIFTEQIDTTGSISLPSQDPVLARGRRTNFADLSLGGVFYDNATWFGLSVHHANQPRQDLEGISDRIPAMITLTAGHAFYFTEDRGLKASETAPNITATMLYKRQGPFQQLDIGAYAHLLPAVIGIWYRGLPVLGGAEGITNQDAIVLLAGLRQDNLSLGYSYDINLSGLVPAWGGSHEVSVSYAFKQPDVKRRSRHSLPCPRF